MGKIAGSFLLFLLGFFIFVSSVDAQEMSPRETLVKAEVVEVLEEGEREVGGYRSPYQRVRVRVLDGDGKGSEVLVDHGSAITSITSEQKVKPGDKVVVAKYQGDEGTQYQIVDRYRLDKVLAIVFGFFFLVVGLTRWRGVGSIVGLIVSLVVITKLIVPQILAGHDPVLVVVGGSLIISVVTIYLAHGFSKKTTIALAATLLSLIATGVLSSLLVELLNLTGMGNEDAYSLSFGPTAMLNLKGLLLGGFVIGALGVLDDITTGLATTIEELIRANPKRSARELVAAGMRVGSEHIASLVNTLVLAYAGAGLPIFLFFVLNPNSHPMWAMLNSEFVVEELIRTLAGSIGLVLAVPITAFMSVAALRKS